MITDTRADGTGNAMAEVVPDGTDQWSAGAELVGGTAPMVNGPVVRLFWRALDGLDYWVMQARLWLVQAVCDPGP